MRVHWLALILLSFCVNVALADEEDALTSRTSGYFDEIFAGEDKALSRVFNEQLSRGDLVAKLRKELPLLTPAEQAQKIEQLLNIQKETYTKLNWAEQTWGSVFDRSRANPHGSAATKLTLLLGNSEAEISKLSKSGDPRSISQILDVLAARQEAIDWASAENARLEEVRLIWSLHAASLESGQIEGFFDSLGMETEKILKKQKALENQIEALDRNPQLNAYRDSGRKQALEEEYRLNLKKLRAVYEASEILPRLTFRQNLTAQKVIRGFVQMSAGVGMALAASAATGSNIGMAACAGLAAACFTRGVYSFASTAYKWDRLSAKNRLLLRERLKGGSDLEVELVLAKLTEKLLASVVCRTSGGQTPAKATPASEPRTRLRVAPEKEAPRTKTRIGEMTEPVEVGVPESQRGVIRNER